MKNILHVLMLLLVAVVIFGHKLVSTDDGLCVVQESAQTRLVMGKTVVKTVTVKADCGLVKVMSQAKLPAKQKPKTKELRI